MAYPMSAMPSLREFVAKALSHGIVEGKAAERVMGPGGEEEVRYLRRPNGPAHVLPNIGEEESLDPFVVSSLCRQLKIPPEEFGLTLGFIQNPMGLWEVD